MTDEIKECYRILEIDATASPDEVKKAWLDFQKFYHPDRLQHDPRLAQRGQEKLKKINAAYDTLKLYFSSAEYCQTEAEPTPPPRNSRPEPPPPAPKTYSYSRPKSPPDPDPREQSSEAYLSMTCFRCQKQFTFPEKKEGEYSSCPYCGGSIQLDSHHHFAYEPKVENPKGSKPNQSFSQTKWRLVPSYVAFGILIPLILVGLMLYGRSSRTVEGTIERPVIRSNGSVPKNAKPGSVEWRLMVLASSLRTTSLPLAKGEVLVVEEETLRQLVLEYNKEITEKSRVFQSRFDAAIKETTQRHGAHPAELGVAAEWRDLKRNVLFGKIYGQKPIATNATSHDMVGLSRESESSQIENAEPETSGTLFLFTDSDAEGRFRLTLPHGGVWCFFIIAKTPAEQCYWFKRRRFLFAEKQVAINAADKVSSFHRDEGDFVQVIFNTKDDFIIRMLKQKYGLLDLHLNGANDL